MKINLHNCVIGHLLAQSLDGVEGGEAQPGQAGEAVWGGHPNPGGRALVVSALGCVEVSSDTFCQNGDKGARRALVGLGPGGTLVQPFLGLWLYV